MAKFQILESEFKNLTENNTMEEIDGFGAKVRQALAQTEKKTVEFNNLQRLKDQVWDLLFTKIEQGVKV